jgi:hypothetical protein
MFPHHTAVSPIKIWKYWVFPESIAPYCGILREVGNGAVMIGTQVQALHGILYKNIKSIQGSSFPVYP